MVLPHPREAGQHPALALLCAFASLRDARFWFCPTPAKRANTQILLFSVSFRLGSSLYELRAHESLRLPTSLSELPTSLSELPTSLFELPTTLFELRRDKLLRAHLYGFLILLCHIWKKMRCQVCGVRLENNTGVRFAAFALRKEQREKVGQLTPEH